MAKHGLGQVDLNIRARLAIMGMSEDPARDIEALLSSGQPIESSTRALLTDLFGGRTFGAELVLKNTQSASAYRRVRKRLVMTEAVEPAATCDQHGKKTEMKEQLAVRYGCSIKTVEKYLALRAKAKNWARGRLDHPDNPEGATEWHLFVAYLFADALNKRPEGAVNSTLLPLCDWLENADQDHADGVIYSDPPISKIRFR